MTLKDKPTKLEDCKALRLYTAIRAGVDPETKQPHMTETEFLQTIKEDLLELVESCEEFESYLGSELVVDQQKLCQKIKSWAGHNNE